MKNLFLLSCFLGSVFYCQAQTEQYHPYKKYGSDIKVLTLSNGEYDEFFDTDTIAIVGSAVLNTKTMKVIGFVEQDTMYSEATMEPEVVSRWLSPDPLARNYPGMSPYNFAANSPILFIDTDGRKIYAYTQASQQAVLKALNYAFGEEHGFSFVDNLLVQTAEPPKEMTDERQLVFNYFNEVLVKSMTPIYMRANQSLLEVSMPNGTTTFYPVKDGQGATFPIPATYRYGSGRLPILLGGEGAKIEILLTPGLMNDGINLYAKSGLEHFSTEHGVWHEWGHAIMNVIKSEFGGVYKDVNQGTMTSEEILDWSIRLTNTISKDKGMPIETGEGQHERKDGVTPAKDPAPLTK